MLNRWRFLTQFAVLFGLLIKVVNLTELLDAWCSGWDLLMLSLITARFCRNSYSGLRCWVSRS